VEDILEDLCILNYKPNDEDGVTLEDIMLLNIEKDFISGNYNTSNLESGNEDIIELEKIIITLTTSQNQKNNKNYNVTTLDLKECEVSLRKEYNISDQTLFIKKIDVIQEGMKIPKIEYDIYCKLYGTNLIKLNLTVCENNKIDLSIPVKITEDIDKLNGKSGYYNDICYIASDNGSDISLNDRKNEFMEGNKTICQDDCEFIKYDYINEKAICSCKPKKSPGSFIDMQINKTKLLENFIDIQNIVNTKLLICYKELFSKSWIKTNIAFYIIIPIIIFHLISIVIFYKSQKSKIDDKIKDISFGINNWDLVKEYEKEKKRLEKNENNNEVSKNEDKNKMKVIPQSNQLTEVGDFNKPIKKRKLILRKDIQLTKNVRNVIVKKNKFEKEIIKENSERNTILNKNKNIDNQDIIKKSIEIMKYNDEELNNLSYELALKYDKRKYLEYYLSLIKTKHILIFSFYYNNDYNSKIIKIDFFFINFIIYYTVNALFFDDKTMHKIYEDKGSFNLSYQLPQIIYSSLISSVLNIFLRILSLSEGNILEFKKNKDKTNLDKRELELNNKLKNKFISYFVVSFAFLIFFWYYLSIFGAIYRNTQYHLIEDTLICFGLSLLYPFLIYLFPGLFRIPALSNPNKKNFLYKISHIIQMV